MSGSEKLYENGAGTVNDIITQLICHVPLGWVHVVAPAKAPRHAASIYTTHYTSTGPMKAYLQLQYIYRIGAV